MHGRIAPACLARLLRGWSKRADAATAGSSAQYLVAPLETARSEAALGSSGDLLTAARSVVSPESFDALVLRPRALLPLPVARHVGILSGMRVQAFQNWLLDENYRLKLTDAQLLAVLRLEFPLASSQLFTGNVHEGLSIVSGIRAHYNRDGHHGPSPQSRGMPPSVAYGRL